MVTLAEVGLKDHAVGRPVVEAEFILRELILVARGVEIGVTRVDAPLL